MLYLDLQVLERIEEQRFMPVYLDGVEYLSASEASELLEVSRQLFYTNIKPTITQYTLPGRKWAYYQANDVLTKREARKSKETEELPIVIHGIQQNFVHALRQKGIPCTVSNVGTPEIVPMNERISQVFGKAVGTPVIKRGRLQGVQGTPYRLVCNWYPREFVTDATLELMRSDDDTDMPALIKSQYDVAIEHIEELISLRTPTKEERKNLKIPQTSSVYDIQRTNYASDGTTVVMISDLLLVAKYFRLKYSYQTTHWSK
jgi:hypothetical protein